MFCFCRFAILDWIYFRLRVFFSKYIFNSVCIVTIIVYTTLKPIETLIRREHVYITHTMYVHFEYTHIWISRMCIRLPVGFIGFSVGVHKSCRFQISSGLLRFVRVRVAVVVVAASSSSHKNPCECSRARERVCMCIRSCVCVSMLGV